MYFLYSILFGEYFIGSIIIVHIFLKHNLNIFHNGIEGIETDQFNYEYFEHGAKRYRY